jgi:hypothetical protein
VNSQPSTVSSFYVLARVLQARGCEPILARVGWRLLVVYGV